MILGMAYSGTIGGCSTLVGTPVNLIFKNVYESSYPEAEAINFLQWSIVALPISIIMLLISYYLIVKVLFKPDRSMTFEKRVISKQYDALGSMSKEEKWVAAVFLITALLWFFRIDIRIGNFKIPGWTSVLNFTSFIDDGTIAVMMGFLHFLFPAKI